MSLHLLEGLRKIMKARSQDGWLPESKSKALKAYSVTSGSVKRLFYFSPCYKRFLGPTVNLEVALRKIYFLSLEIYDRSSGL
jgi:hypothetical protein